MRITEYANTINTRIVRVAKNFLQPNDIRVCIVTTSRHGHSGTQPHLFIHTFRFSASLIWCTTSSIIRQDAPAYNEEYASISFYWVATNAKVCRALYAPFATLTFRMRGGGAYGTKPGDNKHAACRMHKSADASRGRRAAIHQVVVVIDVARVACNGYYIRIITVLRRSKTEKDSQSSYAIILWLNLHLAATHLLRRCWSWCGEAAMRLQLRRFIYIVYIESGGGQICVYTI